ncbi:hypothetical protein EWM64_g2751 [Hericium alpestre]|uniref:Uncharacterized protein n=1 Tax=Hericium alpestre TaxID=135208 RepID=A0A4Z0A4K0_9AGAM|nr:hypothetical protein EWM64_g2751 [Hericium alpestre]
MVRYFNLANQRKYELVVVVGPSPRTTSVVLQVSYALRYILFSIAHALDGLLLGVVYFVDDVLFNLPAPI